MSSTFNAFMGSGWFSLALCSFQSAEVSVHRFLFCCNGGLGFAEQ